VVEKTDFGLAMRAANEGPVTSALMGINVGRIQTIVWTISGALCATAGLLIVPSLYVDPHVLTGFFIASLAVVVMGGLGSIGGVLAAGIIFGAVMSVFSYALTSRLTQTLSLVVILVVLAFFPDGIFGRKYPAMPEPPRIFVRRHGGFSLHALARRARGTIASPGWIPAGLLAGSSRAIVSVSIVLAVLVPFMTGDGTVVALTLAGAYALATLGQNVLFGYSGLITVGQSGFMALGAYLFAILSSEQHAFSPAAALVVALFGTAVVAGLLAICVSRLSGVYLALATVAFALAVPEIFAYFKSQSGGAAGIAVAGIGAIGPEAGNLAGAYYATLLLVLALGGFLFWLQHRREGQAWFALKDSPRGAESVGINVTMKKVQANIVAAELAAIAGIVAASNVGYLAPTSFTLWTSIYILAALIIGGTGSVFGAVVGTIIVFAIPSVFSEYSGVVDIGFGLLLVAILMLRPQGLFSIGVRRRASHAAEADAVGSPRVESVVSR
jgi:branched-chain amino acid transport system permease protein